MKAKEGMLRKKSPYKDIRWLSWLICFMEKDHTGSFFFRQLYFYQLRKA